MRCINANDAFHHYLEQILGFGEDFANTKALFNIGFYINNPMDNSIKNTKTGFHNYERNWKQEYAEAEWQWYITGNRNIKRLGELYGKIPEIWRHMADDNGDVNSNYGWQWEREDQLNKICNLLIREPNTRQAAISIYDAKEINTYEFDTPCTYAVQFTILNSKLNMSVVMRSNDLWYGFCNDQYCFSRLQSLVAKRIGREVGEYFHFAHNLHLYNNIIEEKIS